MSILNALSFSLKSMHQFTQTERLSSFGTSDFLEYVHLNHRETKELVRNANNVF